MNTDQARDIIVAALGEVAPEVDAAAIDPDVDLTEQLDLDSMDYLNWLLEIHRTTGIDVPERDYGRLRTVADAARYVSAAAV